MRGRRGRFAIGVLGLALLAQAAPGLAQGTFAYRKSITVNGGAGGLAGGPHLNYPLLVSLPNDLDLQAHVAAGGKDILFRGEDTTTCNGPATCVLAHEIERWDGATGTLIAWVKVPSVSVGTVIYLYYGNAQITAGTQTPASVWDSGYAAVWHLDETGSGAANEYRESTAFGNNGRGGKGAANATPARVNGQIGYAQNFSNGDGTYDFIDGGSDDSLNITGNQITLEAWIRHNIVIGSSHGTPPAVNTPYGVIAHKGYYDGYSLWLYGTDDGTCPGSSPTTPCVIFNLPGQSYSLRTNMTTGPSAGVWHHIVATYDGATTTISLYQDGALVTTLAKTGNVAPSGAEPDVYLGQGDLPENVAWSAQYVGDLDEVRISRVSRSANWILTEYRNELAPASFYALGAETSLGGPWALTAPTVNYRSIGTAADYTTGNVSATNGSTVVTGVGTAWKTANRGRGDRITINAIDYTIFAVDSETSLRLTSPFQSATGPYAYTIARKFNTPQAWEDCISFAAACPGVTSANFVTDNRSEVGIVYYDGANPVGSPVVTIDGSTTDPTHTITLTADPGNRHPGRGSAGPTWAAFGNGGANATIQVYDDYVTVEWLEILQSAGGGASSHGIEINNLAASNHVVVRYNVIHSKGNGIQISDPDTVADIYDNMIYNANQGIALSADLTAAARVNIFNNTIYKSTSGTGPSGIYSSVRQTSARLDLRNNIVHSNANGDIGVAPFFDRVYFFNGAFSDITAQTTNATLNATLNFTTVGTDCLYLGSANPFRGVAVDLATGGAISGASLQWSYWNGLAWANLPSTNFADGTNQFQWNGYVYWSDDPPSWATTSVNASLPYYYVRACLAAGSYTTKPIEKQLGRADLSIAANSNLTSDQSGIEHSPRSGFVTGQNGVALASVNFVNTTAGAEDLHLLAGSVAVNAASTLDHYFTYDIDAQVRAAPWDIGADELNGTTEVHLQSLTATAGDASVVVAWRTASELDNLGFYVYRALAENGPWTRLTATLIPGLGSSAVGQAYSYVDKGLVNGTRYFYRVEDVDAASRTTSHGPVSAVPQASAPSTSSGGADAASAGGQTGKKAPTASCPDWVVSAYASVSGASTATAALTCTRHGDPDAVSLGVVSRDSHQALVELATGGFYALHEASGRVRVFVPGFDLPQDEQAAALPLRRALVDAVVGRRVELGSVRVLDQASFGGLVPAALGSAEMVISRNGTVRAGRRVPRQLAPGRASGELAVLLPSVFQGESKSAVVLLSPLRYDARSQQLLLAKRLQVQLLFTGRDAAESGRGSLGRRRPGQQGTPSGEVLARLFTTSRGLYAVGFEQLFPGRGRPFAASELSLERQGEPHGFHLEPAADRFGPGSVLYFYADAVAASSDFSSEIAWELVHASGPTMPVVSAAPAGSRLAVAATGTAAFETNRIYQPGLLEAEDLWLWDALASGVSRVESFTLAGVDPASSGTAELTVFLQGASESGAEVDHHMAVSLAGVPLGDAQFAGKRPYQMKLSFPASLLHDGANQLELTNLPDTGVSSLVFLDRFSLAFPLAASVATGTFEGTWAASGTATLAASASALLDVSGAPAWLRGYDSAGGELRFHAQAGHRYLAVSGQALLAPRVAAASPSALRSPHNQADYLLIAPRAFLAAAEPLRQRREAQGLAARAIAFEEITDAFGYGQPSAEAIRSFLEYAYQSWSRPSPRYVLLLGDANYDPRHFSGATQPSPLPALWLKTSYLWTASDPQLAAVNGDDPLPDIAIGRLPATTPDEARVLVDKLLAWEDSGQGVSGPAVLVADNPDLGGDFEADAQELADTLLASRSPKILRVGELGDATRPAIRDALDSGLGLLSYVGHGGAAVWASENVWNSWDAATLQAQSRQPLLLTLDCLNGYFVAPAFDSLAESLVKAEGRGAIASVSPSGLSLDGPAHQYHLALVAELTSGRHQRLGDAILAAQQVYARSGLMSELLSVYHLFGDPALKLR